MSSPASASRVKLQLCGVIDAFFTNAKSRQRTGLSSGRGLRAVGKDEDDSCGGANKHCSTDPDVVMAELSARSKSEVQADNNG